MVPVAVAFTVVAAASVVKELHEKASTFLILEAEDVFSGAAWLGMVGGDWLGMVGADWLVLVGADWLNMVGAAAPTGEVAVARVAANVEIST